jgi:hypothetical protein
MSGCGGLGKGMYVIYTTFTRGRCYSAVPTVPFLVLFVFGKHGIVGMGP